MSQQLARVESFVPVATGQDLIFAARSLIGCKLDSIAFELKVIEVLYGPEAVAKAHQWDKSRLRSLAACRVLRPFIYDIPGSQLGAGDVAVVLRREGPYLGMDTLVGEHPLIIASTEKPFVVIHALSGRVIEQVAEGFVWVRSYRLRPDGNVKDRINLADGLRVEDFRDFDQLEDYCTEEKRRLKALRNFDRYAARKEKRARELAEQRGLRLLK